MDAIKDIKTNPDVPLSKVFRNYLKFTFQYLVTCGKVPLIEKNYTACHSDIYVAFHFKGVFGNMKKKTCYSV
jgi:hypothetical protein